MTEGQAKELHSLYRQFCHDAGQIPAMHEDVDDFLEWWSVLTPELRAAAEAKYRKGFANVAQSRGDDQ